MIEPISAGIGIVSGIASIFGGGGQAAQTAYQNTLSIQKTKIMNAYRKRAYERTVKRVKEQFNENYAAANASFQTEQAKFAEQMQAFAYQKEGLMQQLQQAEGYAAATETYGRSAERAKAIQTLGDYGRSEARYAQSVSSAQRQYGRNLGGISGQLEQANQAAIAPILDGAPIPEMAAKQYEAPGGFFNTAMKIMGGVQTGLSAYKNFDMAFNAKSKFLPKQD